MYKYKGQVEVVVCIHTHSTRIIPFYFEDKHVLTRELVKSCVITYLHKMNYEYFGIKTLTYSYDVL